MNYAHVGIASILSLFGKLAFEVAMLWAVPFTTVLLLELSLLRAGLLRSRCVKAPARLRK